MIGRVAVIGAGAVGCVIGGLLTKAGHDVTLVDQWPEHVETMKRQGLRLSGTCGEHHVRVRALHIAELQAVDEPFDVVVIAVKSYDTAWATTLGAGYLRPDGVVLDCQNGINDHRVAAIVGAGRALGCVVLIGAGLYEPAHAMRTDHGTLGFKIGEHDNADSARARDLVRLLGDVAATELTTNLWGERWSKLALNCLANPLSALSGFGTAEVRTDPTARRLAVHLAAEAILVGRAAGFELGSLWGIPAQRFVDASTGRGLAEIEADLTRDAASRGAGRPSMLQDVMRGRRTEIDAINGYVVEEGRRLGVPTPLNEAVVRVFHAHGVGKLRSDPKHLAPLRRMVP